MSALRVKRTHKDATMPIRASKHAAGYDITSVEDIEILPGGMALVPTGISIAIPTGTYARIAPRSGLTVKYSLDVGAGVIDPDYRGEIKVVLFNHDTIRAYSVKKGERIAQIILERIETPDVIECDDLDLTERHDRGFGSTGLK